MRFRGVIQRLQQRFIDPLWTVSTGVALLILAVALQGFSSSASAHTPNRPGDFLALGDKLTAVAVDNRHHQAVVLAKRKTAHIVDLVDRGVRGVTLPAKPETLVIDEHRNLAIIGVKGKKPAIIFLDMAAGLLLGEGISLPDKVESLAVDPARGLALAIGDDRKRLYTIDVVNRVLLNSIELGEKLLDVQIHHATGKAYLLVRRDLSKDDKDDDQEEKKDTKKDKKGKDGQDDHEDDDNKEKENKKRDRKGKKGGDRRGHVTEILVIGLVDNIIEKTIAVSRHARSFLIDEQRNQLILALEKKKKVQRLDLSSQVVQEYSGFSRRITAMALQPLIHTAVIISEKSGKLALLNLQQNQLTHRYAKLKKPRAVALSTRFNQALVVTKKGGRLYFIPLPNAPPSLTAIAPDNAWIDSPALILELEGEGFIDGATVSFGGETLATEWIAPARLQAQLPAGLLTAAGEIEVMVTHPAPGGGNSSPLSFTLIKPNPVPLLTAITPDTLELPEPPAPRTLTLTGKGFVADSQVFLGARVLAITYNSETGLSAIIPPELLQTPGTAPVTVFNPEPGGGTSAARPLTLLSSGPRIQGFSPQQGPVGTLVTLIGTGFDALSTAGNRVAFNGAPATVVSATEQQLQVLVPLSATSGPITAANSSGSDTTTVPYTVEASEDFDITFGPQAMQIAPGGNAFTIASLNSLGLNLYAELVTLSVTNLPTGITAAFSHPRLSLHQPVTLSFSAGASAAAGTYDLTLEATGPAERSTRIRTATLQLTVLPADETSVGGRVLHAEDDRPFVGARIHLGGEITTTDQAGYYQFINPPLTGDQVVLIDGDTNNSAERNYPSQIPMPVLIVPGRHNRAMTSYIAAIDTSRFTTIVPGQATDVTDPDIPNYALRIPQGAVIIGTDGQPNEKVNVRMTPADRLPIRPLPAGVKSRSVYLYYFFKPGGGDPSEPIPVTMNNDLGLLPGEKATLWYYDEEPIPGPDTNQWRIMGSGTVSADGRSIVSDPGVGIPKFCCGATTAAPAPDVPNENPKGGDGGGPCGGNPVDLASGIGSVLEDHAIGINGLFPVRLGCGYQSNSTRRGPFGPGTHLNTEWRLLGGGEAYVLSTPDGIRYTLSRGTDGIYRATSGRAGGLGIEAEQQGSTVKVRFKEGTVYEFITGGTATPLRTLLMAREDPSGNRITIHREVALNSPANGRILTITDANGRRYRFNYASDTRISAITDPIGRTQHYEYDPNGRLSAVVDYAGNRTEYVWNSNDRIISKTDSRGNTTQYHYDTEGRTTGETLTDGSRYQFDYSLAGGTVTGTTYTDTEGRKTTYRFNGQGYETRRTDPLGRVFERRRDYATNQLRSTTDPLGRTTWFTYDPQGNRTSRRDHTDRTWLYNYDPVFNKITQTTDPAGRLTSSSYDAKGNLKSSTNAANETSHYTYTPEGLPKSITDPLGNSVQMAYDSEGNLITITDALGRTGRNEYDTANRLIASTDPLGRTTRYAYDILDRLIRTTDPKGGITEIAYDPQGRIETVKDPKGAVIETNTYNNRGWLQSRSDAAGNLHSYTYDRTGNLISRTDPMGQTFTYQYDALNRLTEKQDADGRTTRYRYDIAGRLTWVSDSETGETRYDYDTHDRLTRQITPQGTIEYSYDILGRLNERKINGTDPTTYAYDAAGRIATITHSNKSASYHYDGAGRLIRKQLPNGISQHYTLDAAGQVLNIRYTDSNDTPLERIDYQYDPTGSRISRTRQQGQEPPETPFTATYDADNRMLTYNGYPLTYDQNGNLISKESAQGITTYSWDVRNQLTEINGPNGHAAFRYDHQGRRIEKTINGQITQYLYDGAQAIVEIEGGILGATYHNGLMIDEVLARYIGQEDRTLLTDALGSVIAQTDDSAAITGEYSYSPFGEVVETGEISDNPLQYTGRENDQTGLYYYRARYYDPSLKRFISRDPIGLDGGINVYGYVINDPINLVDPDGERYRRNLGFNRTLHELFENLNDPRPYWRPPPRRKKPPNCSCPAIPFPPKPRPGPSCQGDDPFYDTPPPLGPIMCSCE